MKIFPLILFTLLSTLTSLSYAEIYRSVDEDGNIHFSDTGLPDTKEVQLQDSNMFSTNEKINSTDSELSIDNVDLFEPIIQYQATILSPENDMAVRSNDGSININVSTTPKKENTHTFQLYLDGKKLGSPQMSSSIRALNIDRGTHQVQVELLNSKGRTLAKTQIVTVHLLRATVN